MFSISDSLNKDIVTSAILFGLLYYIFENNYILMLGIVYCTLCIFLVPLSKVNSKLWRYTSKILNRIISPILFTIIYFFILTPTAFIRKLIRRKESKSESTFRTANYHIDSNFFKVPW